MKKPITTFAQQVEYANSRGIGQLHVFKGDQYQTTWRSFEVAKAAANECRAKVVNSSGDTVYVAPGSPGPKLLADMFRRR
jgi:hypothetical protein